MKIINCSERRRKIINNKDKCHSKIKIKINLLHKRQGQQQVLIEKQKRTNKMWKIINNIFKKAKQKLIILWKLIILNNSKKKKFLIIKIKIEQKANKLK